MTERPGWIVALFRSGVASGGIFESQYSPYRQGLLKRQVLERVDSIPGGREQLRDAALEELQGADPQRVGEALAFLLVVGRNSDCGAVEPLTRSDDERIRKAAKTCLYELRRRGEDA